MMTHLSSTDAREPQTKPDYKEPFSWHIHSEAGWVKVVIIAGHVETVHYYHSREQALHGLIYRLGRGELGK